MPTVADVVLDVQSLRAERQRRYEFLVQTLAGQDAELDPGEVDEIVTLARKTMRDLVADVDRLVERRRAAEVAATAPAVEQAQRAAMDKVQAVTESGDLELARLREKQNAELKAAIAARNARVAAAQAELDAAAQAVRDVESAVFHLKDSAAPELKSRIADIHIERNRIFGEINERCAALAECERVLSLNPVPPDRDEHVRPFGGTQIDVERARADEQRHRREAKQIAEREQDSIRAHRRVIAEVLQPEVARLDAEIREAEAALLVP
ncbi:hypothetical protein [Gemmata sp.]|uniref:hypothetical protein n=1 Tax=Gemmata sp. TaxID=1914242 RepID=UPI003F719A4A